jgi:hypothetical protein
VILFCRDSSRWPRGTLYPQTLALTSPTSGGRSVCIVRLRTRTTEFVLFYVRRKSRNSCVLNWTAYLRVCCDQYFAWIWDKRANVQPTCSLLEKSSARLICRGSYWESVCPINFSRFFTKRKRTSQRPKDALCGSHVCQWPMWSVSASTINLT